MTFTEAMQAARDGKRVKRSCWYAYLVKRGERIEFEKVRKGLSKTYKATGIEMHAVDWQTA